MYRFGDPHVQALWDQAIRAGGKQTTQIYARRDGRPLYGDDDGNELPLPLDTQAGGTITDNPGSGGVRRTLEATFADEDGSLFDLLTPAGTTLVAEQTVWMVNGDPITLPAGVFDVDVTKTAIGPTGGLQITAPDLYARIQRARFLRPQQSRLDYNASWQIRELIWGALGANHPVLIYTHSNAPVPNVVWESDRAKAVEDMATAAGLHVGFDREGRAIIIDLPTIGPDPDWLVDASASGVLISGDRSAARRTTANVVKVSPDAPDSDGPRFAPVVVWDTDPGSFTYAGPDPENRPDLAGPFGVVVYNYSSPLLTDQNQATQAARRILAKVTGLGKQVTLTAVRNPALEAFDIVTVLMPPRRPGGTRLVEHHIVDSVTHPLAPDGAQQITGRSTRADEYGG